MLKEQKWIYPKNDFSVRHHLLILIFSLLGHVWLSFWWGTKRDLEKCLVLRCFYLQ